MFRKIIGFSMGGGRQTFFGWGKITLRSLIEFWDLLTLCSLERITPPTVDETQVQVWDGLKPRQQAFDSNPKESDLTF